jgi:hypothetical protein
VLPADNHHAHCLLITLNIDKPCAHVQAVYCCGIVASSQDLAFVYAIAWTALNLLVNPYMAMFNLYSLGWGFSWLRFFSPFNYAWQVGSGLGFRVLGLSGP